MLDIKRLLRNSLLMSGSVVAGGVVLFLIFVLIARYLGVGDFGHFVFILTLASIFQLFADGGIINITIRDIARDRQQRTEILGSTRLLVWLISLAVFALVFLFVEAFVVEARLKAASYLMGVAALSALHGLLYAAVVRAYEEMGLIALVSILHKFLLLGLVWLTIRLDWKIEGVAAAHLLANALQWIFFSMVVDRRYGPSRMSANLGHWKYLLGEAIPLGIGMVLRRLGIHMGTLMLAAFSSSIAVGLFNSAYRFLQMIEIGTVAICSVAFPVFARLHKTSMQHFTRLYVDSIRLLVVLSAPIAGLLIALGDQIVLAIYGPSYADAGIVLRILGIAMLFLMPGALMHSVFSALGKQQLFMRIAIVGTAINAIIGVLSIPTLQSMGAALATLSSEFVMFAGCAWYLKSLQIDANYLSTYLRAMAGSLGLALLLVFVEPGHGWLDIVAATLAYLAAYILWALFTGLLSRAELVFLKNSLRPGGGAQSAQD